ncbi:sensor histidine kinase [Paenibacillus sedimenti]|uniref:Sensor histidine kinase n=1 Tax=Paenibacillus sedimenti TaxID=2770274 RepID=A0A926KKI3_9BACL|nr:sensor histidine kinase [Paenibacillus sedimenti]MBD0379459.1 sensor histidine kinase [Paenibacillus sedimenti]
MNLRTLIMRWNNLRLRNKLLFLYFVAVFLPVMITNAVFYQITAENVKSQKISDLNHALETNKDNFRKVIDGIIGISAVLYTDSVLSDALDKRYSSTNEMLTAYNEILNSSVNQFVPINKQFYNAYLYTNNDSLISSGVLRFIDRKTENEEWYRRLQASPTIGELHLYTNKPGGSGNMGTPAGKQDQAFLSVIRKLDFFRKSESYTKLLKIDILPQFVKETLEDSAFEGKIYLVNEEGTVVYASSQSDVPLKEQMQDERSLVLSSRFDRVNYLKGWQMIGIYPKGQLIGALTKSRLSFVYLTCANLIVPSLIIMVLSRSLNSRIVLLWKQMKLVKNQHFTPLRVEQANDEIGQLTEEFNRMTIQISELIRDVYVAELDRRQAQLNALQSQINPHFLFNTLETIRMNSLVKNEPETAAVIKRLARSFRRSLTWGNDWIPIREEMEFIHDFLEIQKFRFEHRLTYEMKIDEEVLDVYVPKMSLLPIVENACIHGIEGLEKAGFIHIRGFSSDTSVRFEVSDNGVGMSAEKLEALLDSLQSDGGNHGDHVGLRNVHNRLKLSFDREFKIVFTSGPGEGTTVQVSIPKSSGRDQTTLSDGRNTHVSHTSGRG